MGTFVGEKQRFNMEKEVLSHLNLALEHMGFCNPKELKALLLTPKIIGEVIIYSPRNDIEKEFFMGISYLPLRSKRNGEESDIEGVILDRMGVGFIKGIESHIDGIKGLNFVRKNIVYAGVSKEAALRYDCSMSEKDSNNYKGVITGAVRGEFQLYLNDDSKFLIHNDISEYFDMFVRGPKLVAKGP